MPRAQPTTSVPVTPQTLFDLAPYEIEHKPAIVRQERMQTAALEEAQDAALPVDARLLNLRRARIFIDSLIDRLTRGDDR